MCADLNLPAVQKAWPGTKPVNPFSSSQGTSSMYANPPVPKLTGGSSAGGRVGVSVPNAGGRVGFSVSNSSMPAIQPSFLPQAQAGPDTRIEGFSTKDDYAVTDKPPFDVTDWMKEITKTGELGQINIGVNERGEMYVISAEITPYDTIEAASRRQAMTYPSYETAYAQLTGWGAPGRANLFEPWSFGYKDLSPVPYVNPYSAYLYDYIGYVRYGTSGFIPNEEIYYEPMLSY